MGRYNLEKSLLPNHYIVKDVDRNIFCMFEHGKFHSTHEFGELPIVSGDEIEKMIFEMKIWLIKNHIDKF